MNSKSHSDPTRHLGLLVIDMQDAFLNVIPDRKRLMRRVAFAIEAASLFGCSIGLTEQMPQKLGTTSPELSALLPENTPVFDKSTFSSLQAEGVHRWIESNQIDHLLLVGIETPICIYQTAVQALGEDIGVTLLADCIGERRHEDRAHTFTQLLAMDAHVLPAETIFYSLLGAATHPGFRRFTKLVKKYQ